MNTGLTNDFEVRLATLAKLGGDASKPTNIYECDLEILERTGQGGVSGATIDDTTTSLTKTWSSSKINSEILSAISVGFKVEVVTELPEVGVAKVLYLVPKQGATTSDVYDEYIWVNSAWEKIGSTQVDLSNYYTKAQVDDKVASAKTEAVASASAYTYEQISAEVIARNSAIDTAKSEAIGSASGYTDEKIAAEVTARDNAIATAKSEAEGAASAYTDGKISTEVSDRNSAIATAKAEAIGAASGYTDEQISAEVGNRNTAISTAKDEAVGAASAYTDTKVSSAKDEAIGAASAYTDEKVLALSGNVVTALSAKQDTLVSATNIKTINNQSILGAGNIDIQGGGGASIVDSAITSATTWSSQKIYDELTEDEEVIAKSLVELHSGLTAVEGDVVVLSGSVATKQATLVSGTNIKTINNQSLLGSGNIDIQGGGGGDTNAIEGIIAEAMYKTKPQNSSTIEFDSDFKANIKGARNDGYYLYIDEILSANKIRQEGGEANNDYVACLGYATRSGRNNQTVVGQYSKADASALFVVGNGTDWSSRSNGFMVYEDGSAKATAFKNTNNERAIVGTDTTIQLKMWTGTEAQYEALVTKDNNTVYIIKED